jgi:uncharacterized phage protein gp47/JayE
MVAFKSLEEIALNMLDFLRLVHPDLDTKPGTVARDLFVDTSASELSKLYSELRNIANLQSLSSAIGTDLDRLARNFGLTRNTGAAASGTVFFTTNDLTSDIFIPVSTQVISQSGATFLTGVDAAFDSTKSNIYRSNALRIRSELDLGGITDEFALEVPVEASTFGTGGNVGKFGIIQQNVPGVSNVTNIVSLTGGTDSESDSAFRSRALGVFAGSNVGTTLGYINAILTDPRVIDVLGVEPGDTLMVRDGTQTSVNSAGETIIISSGTGGKVDLYIQGTTTEQFSESFIFRDISGRGDPTDTLNDFILGQRNVNPQLDFQQRRRLLLQQGTLPFQPADTITSVSGSLSGPNFIAKFTDTDGQTQGSYELLKDTGNLSGSPFGFDALHFIAGQIDLERESASKGVFNGQDALDFTDVKSINSINQDTIISNENSTVSSTDRSLITLFHTPIITTTRVDNLTTGERYTVANQNVDGGTTNTTGRIQVSGGTLPTSSDILQVNYVWDQAFDENIDFDDLQSSIFTRTVQDSVDWGFANRVEAEEEVVLFSDSDGYHIIVEHTISRVINVNSRLSETVVNSDGKLIVSTAITNIRSVTDTLGQEVFNTFAANGSFSGLEITLPTDTLLANGESGTVVYNVVDTFSTDGYDSGSFSGAIIRFTEGTVNLGDTVFADYVANIPTLVPTTALSSLPIDGSENNFVINSNIVGNQPVSNELTSLGAFLRNLRFSPSYLRMNIQGTSATGRLTIKGSSFTRIDATYTVTSDGLQQDLNQLIKNALNQTTIASTQFVAFVDKVEKVTVAGGQVSSVDFAFDLLNYKLRNTQWSNGNAITDSTLNRTSFEMSATAANTEQVPTTGDNLRITFYVLNTNSVENITISASGTHISRNKYVFVDRIIVSTGFVSLAGNIDGTINIQSATQPSAGSTYFSTYSYTAPKEGERIVVTYNFNRLINDSTFLIEDVRPVTADVLIKAAKALVVDISMNVVALPNFTQSDQTLASNVQEVITSFLSSQGLGTIVDASDIINAVYSVDGVDRVEIIKFNETGETGVRRSIQAGRDQFITAGVIEVVIEDR